VPLLREPRIDGVIVEKSISFTTALLARSPDQKSSIRAATSIQLFWRDRVLATTHPRPDRPAVISSRLTRQARYRSVSHAGAESCFP